MVSIRMLRCWTFTRSAGEIHPIAASHGRGVTSLLETALLPWMDDIVPREVSEEDENEAYWAALAAEENGEALEEEEEEAFDPTGLPIKLAIVGRPNVGKSTLTNRILGEDRVVVYDMPGTTRDSIYIPMERDDREYILIDTAGGVSAAKSLIRWKNSPSSKRCRRLKMPTW